MYHSIGGITAVSQCLTCITPFVSLYCRYHRSITVSDLYHSLCIIVLQVSSQCLTCITPCVSLYCRYQCSITVFDLYHSMCIIVLQVSPQYHSVWPVSLPVYHCIVGITAVSQCLTCITPCVSFYFRYHRSISVWPVSLPVYHCIVGTTAVSQCLTCITPCVSLYCRYQRSITVSDLYHSMCIIVWQVSPQYHSVWPVSLPVYHCIVGITAVSQCLTCITPCVSLYCRYQRSITVSDLYHSLCIIVWQVSPQYHSVWPVSLPVYHCIVGTTAVSQCLTCITPCVSFYFRYHSSITVSDLYHSLCIILF